MKIITIMSSLASLLTGCGNLGTSSYTDENQNDLLLHLGFDETSGNIAHDSSNKVDDATISYALSTSPTLDQVQDPIWKSSGAVGGALLFDGYSTWISYLPSKLQVRGSAFSVGAWVAPRAYEWDDTEAVSRDSEYLTGIVSQYYRDSSLGMGFILGYHREGAWTFQCGTGNEWIEVWDEGTPLSKYEWNYVSATFDGTRGLISIYLNGRIVNQKSIAVGSEIMFSDMPLLVGKSNVSRSSGSCTQGVVSGLLDDIRLYNTVLSTQNIRDYFAFHTLDGHAKEIAFSDIWLQDVLTGDAYKTQFHGGPYQNWMNEPHAPIYYQGIYHLFFQFNILGPYFNGAAGIAWGHLVSTDMVNWIPIKEAIVPTAGTVAPDGIWSGGATYGTVKGIDNVPVLLFTAGDYKHPGMISNQNIGLATPKDPTDPYLTEWEVSDELAIEQTSDMGYGGEFRDANTWTEGDTIYLTIGSRVANSARGAVLLYTTTKSTPDAFHHWTFRGAVYDWPGQSSNYGSTWELPVMLPLKTEAGDETGKYILIISPAPASTADNNIVYWIGTFNKQTYRFVPDVAGDPTRMDYGRNVFTGPSGFIDPISGQATIFSIMQDQRQGEDLASSDWTHCVGLARTVSLSEAGELVIKPTSNLDNIKTSIASEVNLSFSSANTILTNHPSDMFHLKVTFSDFSQDAVFGVKARISEDGQEYTTYYYDAANENIGANTRLNLNNSDWTDGNFTGHLSTDGTLTLELFVDHSLLEGFFNYRKTISTRSYPQDLTASGIELFLQSGSATISYFELNAMASIHEASTL